jgi:hypothetical protein
MAWNRKGEADDLAEGMDTGVSPAGRVRHYPLAGETREHLFDGSLDRTVRSLPLPSREAGSVIVKHSEV